MRDAGVWRFPGDEPIRRQGLAELLEVNYQFHLIFLWLPDADMAVARVRERVRLGGHDIPEETIRRRYDAGPRNFFRLYRRLTTSWRFLDNSNVAGPRELASGEGNTENDIEDPVLWQAIKARWA